MKDNKVKKFLKNVAGFTLVELIVVIAIIGALMAIIIPSVYNYVKEAKIKAAIADTKTIKTAVEASLVKHIMLNDGEVGGAFNKVLYLDQDSGKTLDEREYERVGAFTNYSWYVYKTNSASSGASQALDKVIAGTLDEAFTEHWEIGKKVNPMGYNTKSKNCAKYLKDNNTNFGLVVVYNMDGAVRMIQLYRKGILVTYINGEYVVNTNSDAHFIGVGTWSTIYTDSGESSPTEFYKINLSNKQIGSDGNLGGWY